MFNDVSINALAFIASIIASVWSLAWWLNGHFNNLRKDFSNISKDIILKLEYHERHDDVRFSQIRDDIWDIRVRNAATDGIVVPMRHKDDSVRQ